MDMKKKSWLTIKISGDIFLFLFFFQFFPLFKHNFQCFIDLSVPSPFKFLDHVVNKYPIICSSEIELSIEASMNVHIFIKF